MAGGCAGIDQDLNGKKHIKRRKEMENPVVLGYILNLQCTKQNTFLTRLKIGKAEQSPI